MKELFQTPEIEVTKFTVEDVITTSDDWEIPVTPDEETDRDF